MKRILSVLLCIGMMLSGCRINSPLPFRTDPAATNVQNTEPTPSGVPLLNHGISVGEKGNLFYIPNDAVESLVCPEVWLYGNGLLFGSHIRDKYVLRHISLEDGRLLAECEVSASPGVRVCIVIDGFMIEPETVYHEFTHVIDRRLCWDALVRNDALFSEEHWLSLQPDGFAYAMSYTDMPEDTHRYAASGYFVSDYSMTYPTEDRATLFAEAMVQGSVLKTSPGLQAKMDYYARCIRDCFDTEGWPEVTAWELILK